MEANLVSLGADRIDAACTRRMDRLPGLLATGSQIAPLGEQLAALEDPHPVGLARVLAHCPTGLVIAGTTSQDHLAQNVASAAVRLSPEDLARLASSGAV